jgi:hypothetical protein
MTHAQPRKALLFPATALEAALLRVQAMSRVENLLCAASTEPATVLQDSSEWRHLPYIWQDDFAAAFLRLLQEESISHIYSPHPACYRAMAQILASANSAVTLSAGLGHDSAAKIDAVLEEHSARITQHYAPVLPAATAFLPMKNLAGWLRHCAAIHGQSHLEKLIVLGVLGAALPKGDIIEIGTSLGRSAVFLSLMARHYGIGKVLAIDPLSENFWPQGVAWLDQTERTNGDIAFAWLCAHLLPYAGQETSFLRETSADAVALYQSSRCLGQSPFPQIETYGRISLLHLDGNHDLPQITEDLALWTPFMLPRGWIVVDDYHWLYGDGPKQATDRWLHDNRAQVAQHFVADGAMFIQMKS